MKTKKLTFVLVFFITALLGAGFAYGKDYSRKYEVTITNITPGQIFSPPVVITHKHNFTLFNLGETASDELVALAEDGMTAPLVELADNYHRTTSEVAEGPVFPGESITVEIEAKPGAWYLSLAGMLVTTNDAFVAVRGMQIPLKGKSVMEAAAYDAGSEYNSEDCSFIPGPPCGNGGVRDPEGAEGYVHIHSGIHGIGPEDAENMVEPSLHDWRNPVAIIKVRRIH